MGRDLFYEFGGAADGGAVVARELVKLTAVGITGQDLMEIDEAPWELGSSTWMLDAPEESAWEEKLQKREDPAPWEELLQCGQRVGTPKHDAAVPGGMQTVPAAPGPRGSAEKKRPRMRAPKGDPTKKHKCPVVGCSYSAKGTGHLYRHMKTHNGQKDHKVRTKRNYCC